MKKTFLTLAFVGALSFILSGCNSCKTLTPSEFHQKSGEYIYFRGEILEGAEACSFENLGYYGKDKNHVYYEMKLLEGADPGSFTLIDRDNNFARDKNSFYHYGEKKNITLEPITKNGAAIMRYQNDNFYFEYPAEAEIPMISEYFPDHVLPNFPESDFFNYFPEENDINFNIKERDTHATITFQGMSSGYKGDDHDYQIFFKKTDPNLDMKKIANSIRLLETPKDPEYLIEAYYSSLKASTNPQSFDKELGTRGDTQKRKAAFEEFAKHYQNIDIYSLQIQESKKINAAQYEVTIQLMENSKNGIKKNRKFKDIVEIKDNNLVMISSREILEDKHEVIFSPKLKASLEWANGLETIFVEKNGQKQKIAQTGKVIKPTPSFDGFHVDHFIKDSLQFSPTGRYLIYGIWKSGYYYNPMEIVDLQNNKVVYKKALSSLQGFNDAETIFYECLPNPTGETGIGSSNHLNIFEVPGWKIKYELTDSPEKFVSKCSLDDTKQKLNFTIGRHISKTAEDFALDEEETFDLNLGKLKDYGQFHFD